jgi:hypothetical protein
MSSTPKRNGGNIVSLPLQYTLVVVLKKKIKKYQNTNEKIKNK